MIAEGLLVSSDSVQRDFLDQHVNCRRQRSAKIEDLLIPESGDSDMNKAAFRAVGLCASSLRKSADRFDGTPGEGSGDVDRDFRARLAEFVDRITSSGHEGLLSAIALRSRHSERFVRTDLVGLKLVFAVRCHPDELILSAPFDRSTGTNGVWSLVVREVIGLLGGPEAFSRALPDDVVVGIGRERRELTDLHQSCREAKQAARIALVLPDMGPVTPWGELGVHQLGAIADWRVVRDAVLPDGVHRLLGQPRSDLATTAFVYLQRAGDVSQTARDLGLHRQTVYQRLSRIADITGLDLGDGNDRLRLHLALTLAPMLRNA